MQFLSRLINNSRENAEIYSRRLKRILKRSDLKRWSEDQSFHAGWDERTILLAEWIAPLATVVEFGCGQMALKDALPSNCIYIPTDVVRRSEEIQVFDLNSTMGATPPKGDVAVLSGVLEYIYDLPQLTFFLSQNYSNVLTSYASIDHDTLTLSEQDRRGWVNRLKNVEVVEVFKSAGYSLQKSNRWKQQDLFYFSSHSS